MSTVSQKRWNAHAARETVGFSSTTVVTRPLRAPKDSWWTRPTRSREEFDQLVTHRSLEAGWVGKPREDGSARR